MKQIRLQVTAAAKDVFVKGSRIASNWDGEWWLATVTKVAANGDCTLKYDSNHTDTYNKKYMQGKNIMKLPDGTAKRLQSCTLNVIKAIIGEAKVPKAKVDSKWERGDRFACNWDGDWYIGTIVSVKPNGACAIKYDSGDKDEYEGDYMADEAHVIKLPDTVGWTDAALTRTQVTYFVTGKKVSIKDNNEQVLLDKVGPQPVLYAQAQSGSGAASKIKYLAAQWKKANTVFFGGKQRIPNFRLLKDMGVNFNRRGHWSVYHREIAVAPRLFMSSEVVVLTTLVHEMCHQAVSEIDHIPFKDQGEQGHGPEWQKWMRHCGLEPSRYSVYDNTTFMTEEEKEQKKADDAERVEKQDKRNEQMGKAERMYYLERNTPAQYFDANTNTWVKGLLVGKNDQAGKRWMFITSPWSSSWKIIPSEWFCKLPKEEQATYLDAGWLNNAKRIQDYHDQKANARFNRRMYGGLGGLLGL